MICVFSLPEIVLTNQSLTEENKFPEADTDSKFKLVFWFPLPKVK